MKKVIFIFIVSFLFSGCIFTSTNTTMSTTKKDKSLSFKSKDSHKVILISSDDFENAKMIITEEKKLKREVSASGILMKAEDGSEIHFKNGFGGIYKPANGKPIVLDELE